MANCMTIILQATLMVYIDRYMSKTIVVQWTIKLKGGLRCKNFHLSWIANLAGFNLDHDVLDFEFD